jgi:hypothetical protein
MRHIYRKLGILMALLAVLIALLLGVLRYQRGVAFKDPNLELAVRDKLRQPVGPLSRVDLLHVVRLDAAGRGITCLDGIEFLRRLEVLDLARNKVRDVTPLRSLGRLADLDLSDNGIADLNSVNFRAIAHLPLRRLNLRSNLSRSHGRRTALSNLVPLEAMASMEELDLRDNHVADVSPLGGMENLRILDLRGNRVSDVSPLRSLRSLEKLNLRDNALTDFEALASLRHLAHLNLRGNQRIESFEPLAQMTNLNALVLQDVPIGNQLHALRGLSRLHRLDVRRCGISNVSALVELMAAGALQNKPSLGILATLDLRDNPIDWSSMGALADTGGHWANVGRRLPFYWPPTCRVPAPSFSRPGGFYSNAFDLVLSHPDPEAAIVYTLDGSVPDRNNLAGTRYVYKNVYPLRPGGPFGKELHNEFRSHLYSGPIQIYDRSPDPDKLTGISTTISDATENSPSHFPLSPVRKAIVVRAMAIKDGSIPSAPATHTFFVSAPERMPGLPVVSLSLREYLFFGFYNGIYVAGVDFEKWRRENPVGDTSQWRDNPANYRRRGPSAERLASLELFLPDNRLAAINQLVGIRIHGKDSRHMPVKSLRIYARSRYDEQNDLACDIFQSDAKNSEEPRPNRFRRLLLRSHGQTRGRQIYLPDVVSQRLLQEIVRGTARVQPALHFINGEYWGLTTIRERFDAHHLAHSFTLDPANLIVSDKSWGHPALDPSGTGNPSDIERFDAFYRFASENDLADPQVYAQLLDMLDVQSYVDCIILRTYLAAPWGEFLFWRAREPSDSLFGDGKWRVYTWDFDPAALNARMDLLKTGTMLPEGDVLFRNLMANEDFIRFFVNRFADLMNTVFKPEHVESAVRDEYGKIEPYLQEDSSRWNHEIAPLQVNQRFIQFGYARPAIQRKQIRDYFGVGNDVPVALNVSDVRHGHIRINTVEIHADAPGVGVDPYPWTGVYYGGVPIEVQALPNRGCRFAGWSREGYGDLPSQIELLSTEPTLVLTPTNEVRLTAHFAPISPPNR